MSLKMRQGDYVTDGAGGFLRATGTEELLENALFLLAAHRGGFALMPELGSRLYTLGREKSSVREELAVAYAQEALEPLGLTVTAAKVIPGEPIQLELQLAYEGEKFNLEVAVG